MASGQFQVVRENGVSTEAGEIRFNGIDGVEEPTGDLDFLIVPCNHGMAISALNEAAVSNPRLGDEPENVRRG